MHKCIYVCVYIYVYVSVYVCICVLVCLFVFFVCMYSGCIKESGHFLVLSPNCHVARRTTSSCLIDVLKDRIWTRDVFMPKIGDIFAAEHGSKISYFKNVSVVCTSRLIFLIFHNFLIKLVAAWSIVNSNEWC